jgi:hypothetical protein
MFVETPLASKRFGWGPHPYRDQVHSRLAHFRPRAMHNDPSPLPERIRLWERKEDLGRFWLRDWSRAGACLT